MKRITIWHRQLSSQCFSFLRVVCRRVYMRVFSLYCLWTSWAKADASRQMCAKSNFKASLLKLTHFGSRKGKKGSLWHPLLAASPGGIHETNERTHTNKKRDSCHPLACAAMMRGRHRSMGGPIRVRDRREKGDDSLVQSDNFLPLFSFLCWIHVKMSVFLMHPSMNSFVCMCVSIQLFSTHL